MAVHKREQIIDAVITALNALVPATVDEVGRGRVAPFTATINKAITVYQGADVPEDNESWHVIYSVLTVFIDIHVKTSSEQIDDVINSIRKTLSITMWADYTLGLSFIADMNEGEVDKPEIDRASEKVTGIARSSWTFKYSRNRTDPSL